MAITDATEFSTFDNDGDTNGSGVITADTFNEWRKKVNGIINKLVEVDAVSSASYQVAMLSIPRAVLTPAGVSNKEVDIGTELSDGSSILTLDSAGNDFSLATGTYELDVVILFEHDTPSGVQGHLEIDDVSLYNRDTAADVLVNSASQRIEDIGPSLGSHRTLNAVLRGTFNVTDAAHQYVIQYDMSSLTGTATIEGGYITLRKLS